ncbi:helix-turn-helix domain-containing protein [Thermodesulfovibrio sp.]|uniref:helix-turn-helix domain-containing protein n=1 Tax=Thermodesulfovibrio sp. TaxID=2067987 RepID=UPI003099389E
MTEQEKIWKVIRGLNSEFTIDEIAVLTGVKQSTVRAYLTILVSVGYIRKTSSQKLPAKGRPKDVYRLIKNTGPKAPMLRRCLYDPNTEGLMLTEG